MQTRITLGAQEASGRVIRAMSLNFIQRLISGGQQMVNQALPARAAVPAYVPVSSGSAKGYNPFITAQDTESPQFNENYGVNRPLGKPMFMGYRDNPALYGGARLFILY